MGKKDSDMYAPSPGNGTLLGFSGLITVPSPGHHEHCEGCGLGIQLIPQCLQQ